MMMTTKTFHLLYHKTFQTLMPPLLNEEARRIVNAYTRDRIEAAFMTTAANGGQRFEYFRKVLEDARGGKLKMSDEDRFAEFDRMTGGDG